MAKKTKVKARRSWKINPRTRVKESGKKYSRKRKRQENHRIKKEIRE
jgi:hypothetical protein